MESIRLAFQGIWSHRLRSFLTMLGIVIGIASMIAIVSTIQGTNEQIKQNLIGSGNNVVNVSLYKDENPMELFPEDAAEGVALLKPELRPELEKLPGVERVSFFTKRSWNDHITAGKASFEGACYGIDREYLDVAGYQVTYGREFQESDFRDYRKVMILDEKACDILFDRTYPIGKTVEIRGEPYTVVGVAEPVSRFAPSIQNYQDYQLYADRSAGKLFVPDTVWPVSFRFDEQQSVAVRAASTDDMTRAGSQVAEYLTRNQITGSGEGIYAYRSEDLLQQAQKLQQMRSTASHQLVWISAISLLVGGIGVMNIMLVSVTERTGEIGLKKALGAKKRRIRSQFLAEAAVLTGFGGLMGAALGILTSVFLAHANKIPLVISVPAVLAAVIFSTVIGLLFGLLPAMKAANMNPIEALRRE